MTAAIGYEHEFRSELARENFARGEARGQARGQARGEAQAVLTVLDARGVHVPTALREQILACTDLAQLDTWLRRAGTATTIDDVVHG
jgi:hypothetical protein